MGKIHVTVVWMAEDVQILAPEWSFEKCEVWLVKNEEYIIDRLTKNGWEILRALVNRSRDKSNGR